jgi:hypothetical protein
MVEKYHSLPVIQNCWVVPDVVEAARGWIKLGVGPFFVFDVDVPGALYRGKLTPLHFSVAIAQAGPVQIEFIHQRSDGPSAFRDVVPAGRSGFHHVCRAFGDYEETRAELQRQGVPIVTEGGVDGARFCFADTRLLIGCMLEVVDDGKTGRWLVATVRDAALGWAGQDPIRQLPALT